LNKKILFFDLDDTLLTTDKKITPENAKAIERVLSAGHYVAICTGRSICGGQIITKDLGLNRKGCFLVGFQGAMIYDLYQQRTLHTDGIGFEEGKMLFNAVREAGIYAHTYDEEKMHVPYECEELEKYNAVTHEPYKIFQTVEDLRGVSMPKIILINYGDHDKLEKFQTSFAPREEGVFNSFFSCPEFLEYCKIGVNKGSGLRYLSEYLGIPIEDTVAVGDERNDISMVEAAGVGCAMQNGRKELKAVADYITERDNNHSGVAEVIEKFML